MTPWRRGDNVGPSGSPTKTFAEDLEGLMERNVMPAKLSTFLRTLARVALGVTIVLIPFRYRFTLQARPLPPIYGDYTDLLLFASDVSLLATLALWGLDLALAPRRPTFKPLFLTLPIAGVTGMGAVSVVFSVDPILSLYHAIRLILLFGLYLYVLNEIKRPGEIILPVAVQVFIQAAVGIGQVLQQRSLGLTSLGELALDPAWNGVSIVWSEGIRSLRAYGLTDHPNILGGCLAFALVLMTGWYVGAESRWRTPAVGLFALGSLGLLLTFSRAAWLALGGGLVLIAGLFLKTGQARPLRDWLALMGAALILVLPFAWQNVGYLGMRLNVRASLTEGTPENRSIAERRVLNRAVNTVFAEHAVGGVGLGALPRALRNRYPDFPFNYQPAHIVLLDVAAETGVFGALFYSIAVAGPWLALWLNRRRLTPSPALIGVSGVLLAVTIVGFFDYYTWLLTPGRLWQWLVWGLWGVIYQSSFIGQERGEIGGTPPKPPGPPTVS